MKRKASEKHVRKAWKELRSISKVAKRLGYSYCGAARFLNRLGLVNSRA